MRIDCAWLVLVAALAACATGAEPRPEATSTPSPSAAEPSELAAPSTAVPTPQPPREDEPAASHAEPSPTFFTRVSFDLRSLPHRGPYDVDERLVSGRVELLMQQVRDAAGAPAPRLLVYPGASVFRAEFFGSDAEALSQCQRAVAAVATPAIGPGSTPHAALRAVEATPCARIEGMETP